MTFEDWLRVAGVERLTMAIGVREFDSRQIALVEQYAREEARRAVRQGPGELLAELNQRDDYQP